MKYIVLLSLVLTLGVCKRTDAAEADYVKRHCQGKIEVVLSDRTRVDCLTDAHAIEYDFGKKWPEAIGQSLHYAMHTGRRAGVVLIIGVGETRFYTRVKAVVRHYNLPIDIWMVPK